MSDFGDENLVQGANSNGFQYPPSGDDGGGGGDETIMSMMFTATASFERDYDSGAGTCNSACALGSFIVTVVDIEEKGYDGVLARVIQRALWCHLLWVMDVEEKGYDGVLALVFSVCIGVVHCDDD